MSCAAPHERLLNEAVSLRRASRHVRIVSINALTELARLADSATLTHDQIVTVLRPASALADAAIALLPSAAA